jgi:hypothetical protein
MQTKLYIFKRVADLHVGYTSSFNNYRHRLSFVINYSATKIYTLSDLI